MINPSTKNDLKGTLNKYLKTTTPGIQYLVIDKHRTIFEFAGGWSDIQNKKTMSLNTTLMAYSMTKTFTALAILQLAQNGKLHLDDPIREYLPNCPYSENITIRQLISHSSGIPNPIPLRWVHLAEAQENFDEHAALAKVLQNNSRLSFKPGSKYAYSNIGYWLLGEIVEEVTKHAYITYVSDFILNLISPQQQKMGFVIPDLSNHAKGYLGKYSMMNLLKGLITDGNLWGSYEGKWIQVRNHYVNGPAFGGLVGSVQSFACFLQNQLQENSSLLNPEFKELFYREQKNNLGGAIGMTLGWHIGNLHGVRYFFKEGGGGGFHSEMRIYPTKQFASVIMVNSTEFNSNVSLSNLDKTFLETQ